MTSSADGKCGGAAAVSEAAIGTSVVCVVAARGENEAGARVGAMRGERQGMC